MFDLIGKGHAAMHEGPSKKPDLDLDSLERLAAQATPGPWKMVVSDKYAFTAVILPPDFPQTQLVGRIRDEQDAAYIAAACNAVPELIKMYREADDANSAWQKVRRENLALREQVRELERQRDYLAFELSSGGRDQSDCDHPHLPCEHRNGYWCEAGEEGQIRCWISVAEQAAKEAGL